MEFSYLMFEDKGDVVNLFHFLKAKHQGFVNCFIDLFSQFYFGQVVK